MRVRGAMIVWAMAATLLPVAWVPAAETATATPPSAGGNAQPATTPAPAVPVESIPLDARPGGLIYTLDTPAVESRPDALRFDFDRRPGPTTPFRLAPATHAPRAGWAVSGRAGPLRWLTPLAAEGETQMRLGGRVKDQPNAPGLGHFNMSIHYSFE